MPQIVMLAGDVNLQGRADPATAFTHVQDLLTAADVRFVNLEGALSGPGDDPQAPDIAHKPNWRHSEPDMVTGLSTAGIDAVSVANNVAFPPSALLSSLDTLDAAGIAHCGGGTDLNEAHRPVVLERDGTRFGFLAYASICWPFGMAAGDRTVGVATLRASTSYVPDLRSAEVPGPHSLQGIEIYRGRPIFYSLGNFVFDWPVMAGRHLDGLVLHCRVDERRLRIAPAVLRRPGSWRPARAETPRSGHVEVHPVRRGSDNGVRPLFDNEARSVLDRVAALSARFGSNPFDPAPSGAAATTAEIPVTLPQAAYSSS